MTIDNSIGTAFLQTLLATERMPDDELTAHQAELLIRLYRHAVSEVPAYRDRPAPPSTFDANAPFWTDQPFLSRSEVAADRDRFRARSVPDYHGAVSWVSSGGSTGSAVARQLTALESLGRTVGFYRALEAWNFDYAIPFILIRTEQYAKYFEGNTDTTGRADWLLPALFGGGRPGAQYFSDIRLPAPVQLARVMDVAPVNVNTLPSSILRLGLAARAVGQAPSIPFIMSVGEYLAPEVRSLAAAVFGSRIIDVVSSAEAGNIAIQCPTSGLYHIQSELVLAEIIDAHGRSCDVGDIGELVVTPLYNYASPLLRYRSGDYVERGPKCPCGRTLPTIARFVGRKEHMFSYPDGHRALPPIDRVKICEMVGHEMWVLVQTQAQHAELRIAGGAAPGRSESLRELLARALGKPFSISVTPVDDLPLTSGAKRHFTVNRFDA
jgi:phenylacetate-CoA ligase